MDEIVEFDTVAEAAEAMRAAHPSAYKLEATSQDWYGEVHFVPDENLVIFIDDYTDDEADPENVVVRQVDSRRWTSERALIDEYTFALEKVEHDEDEVAGDKVRRLISETFEVYKSSHSDRLRRPADAEESEPGDYVANLANLYLASEIEKLKEQMSLLASLRAQNILDRLAARDHRHGSKREVAEALDMKPQNIQDILAGYYRRLNLLG